jgi:hypothetical protein
MSMMALHGPRQLPKRQLSASTERVTSKTGSPVAAARSPAGLRARAGRALREIARAQRLSSLEGHRRLAGREFREADKPFWRPLGLGVAGIGPWPEHVVCGPIGPVLRRAYLHAKELPRGRVLFCTVLLS